MSNGAGPSAAKKKEPLMVWVSQETCTMIRLGEGKIEDLRRAEWNRGVYEEISEALQRCGIVKSKDQVHHNVKNLTNMYW